MVSIGMAVNSTMLNPLESIGRIAARVLGISRDSTGGTSKTQLDGSMVFGRYDRAKVMGLAYRQSYDVRPGRFAAQACSST